MTQEAMPQVKIQKIGTTLCLMLHNINLFTKTKNDHSIYNIPYSVLSIFLSHHFLTDGIAIAKISILMMRFCDFLQ